MASKKAIFNRLNKSSKQYRRKNVITISLLSVGAVVLCAFLGFMQNYTVEQQQKVSSANILDEVNETLTENDVTSASIKTGFNELNQTTLATLHGYITEKEIFTREDIDGELVKLADGMKLDSVFLVNNEGTIVHASKEAYRNKTLQSIYGYSDAEKDRILTYKKEGDKVIADGTATYEYVVIDNKEVQVPTYTPAIGSYKDVEYYSYSSYFGYNPLTEKDYYLFTSSNSKLLVEELTSVKDIRSILSGVTVGKAGFLFAIDTQKKDFLYFNDGTEDLSGDNYVKYGLNDSVMGDGYNGYQSIKGVRYFCSTQEFSSDTFGQFTIIAAVVAQDELISKIATTVGVSCLAFVVVAAIIIGYGMIIRRDIADHTIDLEKQYTSDLNDEVVEGRQKYSEEEINERVKIKLEETIENNKDKRLSRRFIGTRNKKGAQKYVSLYMIRKMMPVMIAGFLLIFGFSFFSQTLLSLQEAITVSTTKINDIVNTMNHNKETVTSIHNYLNDQYLAKTKLISYIIQDGPEEILVFDKESDNTHPLVVKDEDGNKTYLKDEYGNQRYSIAHSEMLKQICEANKIKAINIYDEDGYCIATNSSDWFINVFSDENPRFNPISLVVDGKSDYEIEKIDFNTENLEDAPDEFIAIPVSYYTYQDEITGETVYVSSEYYEQHKDTTTRHRSAVSIDIDLAEFASLFEVTKLSYILNNAHVYGDNSFIVALDNSPDHVCLYSPIPSSIGMTAKELNLPDSVFKITGSYNGFLTVNGVEYYQTYMLVDDIYFATAIPTDTIYNSRNTIAGYTLLFSGLFILIASMFYTISSDKSDQSYIDYLKVKDITQDRKNEAFEIKTAAGVRRTTSANSRYRRILWKNKTVEQKLGTILMGYLTAVSLIIVVILINVSLKTNDYPIFGYIFSGEWERGFNIFAITAGLMIFILIIVIINIVKILVKSFCGSLGARVETLGNLLVSVVKYGGIIGGIFYVLYLFGLDTTSLLTSAGILTIVVGLGAQSLISDILAGMFIVFEGEFRVGDIVTIGDFRGQVIEIGLRTTKLLDIANNIKIFNNSAISGVLNMTKESSFAMITVGIEYSESLEKVEAVLQKGFPTIKKKLPAIVEGPFYKGVLALNNSSVDIGIIAKCAEQDRIQLARDLNREIFLLFNKNNINIPFPQVTLSYLKEKDEKLSPKIIKQGEEFVKEQKEAAAKYEVETLNGGK